jgi:PAS domain S-box-containing protein
MPDLSRTNQELLEEISALNQKVKEMEQLVAERRRIEDELRASESHLKSISNNLPSAMIYQLIIKADGTRKFTYLSDSVKQLHGISPEEGIADSNLIYKSVYEEDIAKLQEAEKEAIKTLSTFRIEVREKEPSGGMRWSSLASTPSLMENGDICWDGIELVITVYKDAEAVRERLVTELQQALLEVRTLSGLLPICASCKKIREDTGYWNQIENYISKHSNAKFSHSLCPECAKKLYSGIYE